MNQHRKSQLDILKTVGVVYGMTNTHKENRQLLYRLLFRTIMILRHPLLEFENAKLVLSKVLDDSKKIVCNYL